MKKIELNEVKNLDVKAIVGKVTDLRKELAKLQLEKDKKDVKMASRKRKDLARFLTILQQKKLLEQLQNQKEERK